jgi:chemotaxis protein MotB
MMSDVNTEKAPAAGVPAWVMTFADLMTLLMCFFVLLLAFSEMDVMKFKQLSGSMKNAFGVQAEIEVKSIPKGTSVIAQEFSPGRKGPSNRSGAKTYNVSHARKVNKSNGRNNASMLFTTRGMNINQNSFTKNFPIGLFKPQ